MSDKEVALIVRVGPGLGAALARRFSVAGASWRSVRAYLLSARAGASSWNRRGMR
jgi:hypothetical protein